MITETTSVASTAPAMFDPPSGRRTYYDLLMSPLEAAGLRKLRRLLIAHARGDVLEIGVGTGANLAFYDPDCRVIAIDLEQVALELARTKAEATHRPVCFIRGSGHPLCFPDMAFDTVVVTLALCSVLRPKSIMNEIRRVLKPGGQLLLMEHVRSQVRVIGYLQDQLTPAWCKIAHGCHLNRPTERDVLQAGFRPVYTRTLLMGFLMFGLYQV